uniref:Uncharacterized protein n=1 Tax=viral metagenome TaxID=1070528 RepID=A0A6C0CGF8_9ZZZZ
MAKPDVAKENTLRVNFFGRIDQIFHSKLSKRCRSVRFVEFQQILDVVSVVDKNVRHSYVPIISVSGNVEPACGKCKDKKTAKGLWKVYQLGSLISNWVPMHLV